MLEVPMTYTLDAFTKDAKAALAADNSPAGREKVRVLLEKLLTNKQFVDEAVGPAAPMGARQLYEDKDLGFVLVTGRDLDHVKRLKYDMAAGKAITIESASASR